MGSQIYYTHYIPLYILYTLYTLARAKRVISLARVKCSQATRKKWVPVLAWGKRKSPHLARPKRLSPLREPKCSPKQASGDCIVLISYRRFFTHSSSVKICFVKVLFWTKRKFGHSDSHGMKVKLLWRCGMKPLGHFSLLKKDLNYLENGPSGIIGTLPWFQTEWVHIQMLLIKRTNLQEKKYKSTEHGVAFNNRFQTELAKNKIIVSFKATKTLTLLLKDTKKSKMWTTNKTEITSNRMRRLHKPTWLKLTFIQYTIRRAFTI